MKLFKIAAAALMCTVMVPAFSSCEEDEKFTPSQDPSEKIEAPTTSVANGDEVATSVTEIVLTYAKPVTLNSAVSVTLNDVAVAPVISEENRCVVTIPVTLTAATSYVLDVPERAFAVIGTTWFAPAVRISFTTPAVQTNYAALTNANATQAAKNVYDFLLTNSGVKILSGSCGGDSNNNSFADWVGNVAGKYPAVTGYDFLHLNRSGENWIDYSDISAATTQWQNNGLVNYMWHWNAPTDKDALDNKDWSKWSFYSAETEFDIIEALKDGTWQHEFIINDIDKVAGYLQLLDAAGVPVIWRPLHEACGSFKYNNPWFWWGKGGVEATADLWKLMHDRLVNYHGLNNLIWVWTAQYDEGYESQMATAYPGDQYVDIVGVDIYRNDGESDTDLANRLKAAYAAALNMTGGKKLVTLSECGALADLGSNLTGAGFSWFMLWYTDVSSNPDTDGFGNSTAWIKSVFENANVINRADMPSLK